MKIGVFDSGVGGRSVANAIQKAFPQHTVVHTQDKENFPYGLKSPATLLRLVLPILQKLERNCDAIVIACNSVATTIIDDIRKELSIPLIGVEPMVQSAVSMTKATLSQFALRQQP